MKDKVYRLELAGKQCGINPTVNFGVYRCSVRQLTSHKINNRDNLGFWLSGAEQKFGAESHRCPEPDNDFFISGIWNDMSHDARMSYGFAFASIDLLYKWFHCHERLMSVKSYLRIAEYEIDRLHVVHSKLQSLIHTNHVQFVRKVEIK